MTTAGAPAAWPWVCGQQLGDGGTGGGARRRAVVSWATMSRRLGQHVVQDVTTKDDDFGPGVDRCRVTLCIGAGGAAGHRA